MKKAHTGDMKVPRARAARRKSSMRSLGRERITVSLSKDKVRFLKAHRGQAGARSVSALVERLIADAQARERHERLSAQTALYYDSLSVGETEDQSAWGELGETELAAAEE